MVSQLDTGCLQSGCVAWVVTNPTQKQNETSISLSDWFQFEFVPHFVDLSLTPPEQCHGVHLSSRGHVNSPKLFPVHEETM